MNLKELKAKPPAELLNYAEDLRIENASSLRKQEMMFAILKQLAENDLRWAAANRDRILAEWTKRFDAKSEPKS